MIQENLITEYSGTTFSVTKVDGVSRLTFADDPDNYIVNDDHYGKIFMGDGPQLDEDNFYIGGSVIILTVFLDGFLKTKKKVIK